MKTKIITIQSNQDLEFQLQEAAEIIKKGGLVAFPTETVYGLGANALDSSAVKSIFIAKGRPSDNPVIIHIANPTEISKYAKEIPEVAFTLAKKFWPGPLTLVLKKREIIPSEVTAGASTVTIRLPDHKIAQTLIKLAGVPIAAPSANTSGRPSPTTAQHVLADLDGKVDLVIDGGPASVGLESTVLDLILEPAMVLRPGQVTFEELQHYLPNLQTLTQLVSSENIVRSPGMKYKHYSPKSAVVLIHAQSTEAFENKVKEFIAARVTTTEKIAILSLDEIHEKLTPYQISAQSPSDFAHILFNVFRNFEQQQIDVILVQAIPAYGVGRAVMDRLTRAADEEFFV